jgi:3-hydroxyisobutyrate dehydrogenase-like beta-hydroxyacid dehydrogenase
MPYCSVTKASQPQSVRTHSWLIAPQLGQRRAGTQRDDSAAPLWTRPSPVNGHEQRMARSHVGGSADEVSRATPLLSCFSGNIIHVGTTGHGQLAKALNNCLYNVSVAAMAEVLPLAQRSGLDLEAFCRVASSGTGQSFGFDKFSPLVLDRLFEAPQHGYPMGSAFKDMEVVEEVAKSVGVSGDPGSVIHAAKRTYEAALQAGCAGEHKGAMVKVWERKLGVVVQLQPR